jgi:hypothetical protein
MKMVGEHKDDGVNMKMMNEYMDVRMMGEL